MTPSSGGKDARGGFITPFPRSAGYKSTQGLTSACVADAEPVQILNNVTVESKHARGVELGGRI